MRAGWTGYLNPTMILCLPYKALVQARVIKVCLSSRSERATVDITRKVPTALRSSKEYLRHGISGAIRSGTRTQHFAMPCSDVEQKTCQRSPLAGRSGRISKCGARRQGLLHLHGIASRCVLRLPPVRIRIKPLHHPSTTSSYLIKLSSHMDFHSPEYPQR